MLKVLLLVFLLLQNATSSPVLSSKLRMSMQRNMWQYSGKFEGDIVLPNERNGLRDTRYRWANGRVCYWISGSFSQEELNVIKTSLHNGFSGTCIQIWDCWNCCGGDYIDITNDQPGCYAQIGRTGGRQVLNLGQQCVYRHTVIHECMHALGFFHQHTTPDRDWYIQVQTQNVIPDQLHNFDIHGWDVVTDFGQGYDYCSILHYDEYAFTRNNLPTITLKYSPINCPNGRFGWVDDLSPRDRNKVNSMYCSK